jgi:hypothetical protein
MRKLILLTTLLLSMVFVLGAEYISVADYSNEIKLISDSFGNTVLEFTLGSFEREKHDINGDTWFTPKFKNSGLLLEAGYPEVPVDAGSIIIPHNARMSIQLIESDYVDLPMKIAPSKGNLTRNIDPESVAFEFADFYNGQAHYPEQPVELTEPFILRDFRGITTRFMPFVYYPAEGITRVYTRLRVRISQDGVDSINTLSSAKNSYSAGFAGIYQSMFLNFGEAKYPSLREDGDILVITNSMFNSEIIPWVEWKEQIGYNVEVVDVSVAGPSASQMQTYIQNKYNQNENLLFVQLMGDAPQVPTLTANGGGSDPSFALVAGNDNYPDLYVGRFSAQTTTEMATQVQRVLYYERDIEGDTSWVQKAMGIASNEGGGYNGDNGESDQQHMEIIRNLLLDYGYTSVDQMYQNYGATASQVATNVNQGRGVINYVGHGSDTSWVTTGFNNTNIASLTNTYKYPFIYTVACVNGNFVSRTCFAEAWVRATNNGVPTGAVAVYASTVNQGWNPPMRAQDEAMELLTDEAKTTIGGICYNSSSRMMEVYGNSGVNEYKNWHIFGDASMLLRTKEPTAIVANYNGVLIIGMESLEIQTEPNASLTLSADGVIYGKTRSDASGYALIEMDYPPVEPMELTLTIYAFNKIPYIEPVQVLPSDGAYLIVRDFFVEDGNNGIPEFDETITIQVEMENVGSDPAENINIYISTEDPYIFSTGSETLADPIDANTTGSTVQGIPIQISNYVPDQHEAEFTIHIELDDGSSFAYTKSILIHSPDLGWGPLMIDDAIGNQNGTIDPGETVILGIPIINNGHSTSPLITTTVTITGANNVIVPISDQIDGLAVGEEGIVYFEVTLSSQAAYGSLIQLSTTANYGGLSVFRSQNLIVGVLLENFENGLNNFDWQFPQGSWSIVEGGVDGGHAIKSATINHNGTTSMTITMNTPQPGYISFWKKVSSETNQDFFSFHVNGQLKGRWSGTNDTWGQVSYMVNPGTNTYTWQYYKDSSVTEGSDCVWIDDIMFPVEDMTVGSPIAHVEETTINFGDIMIGTSEEFPLTIQNNGDAVMIGTINVNGPFWMDSDRDGLTRNMRYVIPAESSLEIPIVFSPTATGNYSETLTILTDDPDNPSITVNLVGVCSQVSNEDLVQVYPTKLSGNHPNPFNPNTYIRFSLKEKAPVKLDIYNILGQKVITLANQVMNAGEHSLLWDGKDSKGSQVSSGVYFYKMQSNGYQSTRKMVLMK